MIIKVIGIGSPFGDDRLGLEIVDLLKLDKDMQQAPELILSYYDRPNVGLLEHMKNANIVFLIDAIQSDHRLGTVLRLEGEDIQSIKAPLSSHGIGLAEAIALGRTLNLLPRKVIIYGIEIRDIESFEISELVSASKAKLLQQLKQELLSTVGYHLHNS